MIFFTICASNYLGLARTLGESIRALYPDARLQVWLLDEHDGTLDHPALQLRRIVDAVAPERMVRLLMRYSILEFSTAVKAAVFKQVLSEQAGAAIYIDPDIVLFSRLEEVESLLRNGATGVLLPHMLTPLPRDGEHPDDLDILKAGVFNLGFLALRADEQTTRFLTWWDSWLETDCWADPRTGAFTDQKWLNFAPCMWPGMAVCLHAGYDVAYWNLHERQLSHEAGQWQINRTVPLRFYHFSGFDPENPRRLSKHETRHTKVSPDSPLGQLLAMYAREALGNGHLQYKQLALPSLRFVDGSRVDAVCRQAYRHALQAGLQFDKPLDSGPGTFRDWLIQRDIGSRHSRYVKALLALRPDVAQAFPDHEHSQADQLLNWIAQQGQPQLDLDPRTLEQLGIVQPRVSVDTPLGVNYVGYLRAESGVGEAARGYIRALQSARVDTALMDISHMTAHRLGDDSVLTQPPESMPAAPHAINCIHVNADMLQATLNYLGPNFRNGRYNIGLWAWESQHFPEEWKPNFDFLDEIWVGSQFMASAIAPHADVPVLVMPYVVDVPQLAPDRAQFGLADDEYLFFFAFDFHSFLERKNPQALLRAFRQAFQPHEPVRLVIKTMSSEAQPQAMQELQSLAGDARVTFIHDTLNRNSLIRLMASCDAYVSLHRIEGFGLGMAEAMALGKPVIATAYGGNTDFMNVNNAHLIPYTLVELAQDCGPYRQGSLWADPDELAAARVMREVYTRPDQAQTLGRRARQDIAALCSIDSSTQRLTTRLRHIQQSHDRAAQRKTTRLAIHGTPATSNHRMEQITALLLDVARRPNLYLRNIPKAWRYARNNGLRLLLSRVLQNIRGH